MGTHGLWSNESVEEQIHSGLLVVLFCFVLLSHSITFLEENTCKIMHRFMLFTFSQLWGFLEYSLYSFKNGHCACIYQNTNGHLGLRCMMMQKFSFLEGLTDSNTKILRMRCFWKVENEIKVEQVMSWKVKLQDWHHVLGEVEMMWLGLLNIK